MQSLDQSSKLAPSTILAYSCQIPVVWLMMSERVAAEILTIVIELRSWSQYTADFAPHVSHGSRLKTRRTFNTSIRARPSTIQEHPRSRTTPSCVEILRISRTLRWPSSVTRERVFTSPQCFQLATGRRCNFQAIRSPRKPCCGSLRACNQQDMTVSRK